MSSAVARRVVRARCPLCKTTVTIEVDERVMEAAARSPQGLAGVLDVHGDHALVIYFDSNGGARGVKVYTLVSRIEDATVLVPRRYMEWFENIQAFRVEMPDLGFRTEGYRVPAKVFFKGTLDGVTVELSLRTYSRMRELMGWVGHLLRAMSSVRRDIRVVSLYETLLVLDGLIMRPPPPHAQEALVLLLSSRTIRYDVDPDAMRLFSMYAPFFSRYYSNVDLRRIAEHSGGQIIDVLRGLRPRIAYEYIDYMLMLARRGILRIEWGGEA